MTIPPDWSAVHMLIMGAIPMVVPWKYTPLKNGQTQFSTWSWSHQRVFTLVTQAHCKNGINITWSAGHCHVASGAAAWPSSSPGTHAGWWKGPGWWDTYPRHSTPPNPPVPPWYSVPCRTEGWKGEGWRQHVFVPLFCWSTFILQPFPWNDFMK